MVTRHQAATRGPATASDSWLCNLTRRCRENGQSSGESCSPHCRLIANLAPATASNLSRYFRQWNNPLELSVVRSFISRCVALGVMFLVGRVAEQHQVLESGVYMKGDCSNLVEFRQVW